MNKYKELIERYPYLFSTNEMEPIVLFGIECNIGWYHIIESACISLSSRYRSTLSSVKYFEKIIANKQFNEHLTEEKALEYLNKYTQLLKEQEADLPKFEQIKEKFGTLRVYTDKNDDYTRGVIDMAESLSMNTCEVCGSHGKTYTIGWHTTLCPEHAKERYGENSVDLHSDS